MKITTVLAALPLVVACDASESLPLGSAEGALAAAQCDYFAAAGKTTICHATGSAKNPFVVLRVAEQACVDGHSGHVADFVSVDGKCDGAGCLPTGAPCDDTLPCCAGEACQERVCVVQSPFRSDVAKLLGVDSAKFTTGAMPAGGSVAIIPSGLASQADILTAFAALNHLDGAKLRFSGNTSYWWLTDVVGDAWRCLVDKASASPYGWTGQCDAPPLYYGPYREPALSGFGVWQDCTSALPVFDGSPVTYCYTTAFLKGPGDYNSFTVNVVTQKSSPAYAVQGYIEWQ